MLAEQKKKAKIDFNRVGPKYLSDKQKAEMYMLLGKMSAYDAGIALGLGKRLTTANSVRGVVAKVKIEVEDNPERFLPYGVNKKVYAQVNSASEERQALVHKVDKQLAEKDAKDDVQLKDLILDGRKQAFTILMRKLKLINSSKKRLDDANVSSLAQVFGIIFDKGQIIQGQSTENIAMMAKVDSNMTPQQLMQAVLGVREQIIESKNK